MLLRKTVKNDVVKASYESSNILVSEYNQKNNDLTVVFKNGGKYTYNNVKLTDYTRFELADSQGKVLNTHIKAYAFVNHGKIDTTSLTEEIQTIKKADLQEYAEVIKTNALGLASSVDMGIDLTDSKLDEMAKAMETFKSKRDENKR
jgi:hypothetical protein